MKESQFKIIATLFLGIWLTGLQAQTLRVKQTEGTETAYSLAEISKLSFSEGSLQITNYENNSSSYELSNLRYLTVSDIPVGINEQVKFRELSLKVYPNPLTNLLTVQLDDTGKTKSSIEILSVNGKVLTTHNVTGMKTVRLNLSQLKKGIYICRYRNSETTKTAKIVKN
ncbi:T9SS type A sorting domain-containing protein [Mariniphaga sp.]|uniref:T9SS type A sorting domain-containing protein n=1 Tax=Mariniphaga sp. TaxID=1954475 RepID=UPI003566FF66